MGVGFILLLVAALVAPSLLKGPLERLLRENINKNLNATVAWEDLDLSLVRSFPSASLRITNFSVINKAPFEGDTLASGNSLQLTMKITELFKKSEAIEVNTLTLDEAFVNIKINTENEANYDIAIQTASEPTEEEGSSEGFTFSLNKYQIKDSRINYLDESSKTFLRLTEVNHSGKGDLSASITELQTQTEAQVSLTSDNIEYIKNNPITLDADFELDLENQKYTFLENEARINELPLTFNGFVQSAANSTEIDITFNTPSSDFKNFLAVIPKVYVKELDGVSTTGNFTVDGMLKGTIDDTHIPKMDIKVSSDNASFKYPDLPKAVRNISINAHLKNETGITRDTYLTLGGITFKIDDEIFTASGTIRNLTENALINLALKGTLNLANIEKVLPIEMEQDLTGIFKADVTSNFDMQSIENEHYERIKSTGTASLTDFAYTDDAFRNEIRISSADVRFNPGNITLNEFKAQSGSTDMNATGTIQNLIPWIMAKQDLKGHFTVQSSRFNINDFMASEVEEGTQENGETKGQITEESIKIPDFLDATMDFTATKVIYDDIELDNASGTVSVRDETAHLRNMKSKVFGGDVVFSGNVSTLAETPTFAMNLDLQKIDIDASFKSLALLKYIAPIAQALDGDLNTTLVLNGSLDDNLVPDLSTLAGNALAQVLTAEINSESTPILSKLDEQLPFLNIGKLSLRDLSTALTFDNGHIEVQPFEFEVEDVTVTVNGSHGLDKSMNYNLSMDVPAHYLGNQVTSMLQKLSPEEASEMSLSLPVGITGTLTNPAVSLNTQGALQELTQKIIEKQKQELEDKGINILEDLLGGGNQTTTDTTTTTTGGTTTQQTTEVITDILGGLFGTKKKDSTDNGNNRL